MNVQDFFSIVQLGVGIHAGTAILQLSGELGVAPVDRRMEAIDQWIRQERERGFELEAASDQLALLRVDLILFRAKYDRLYRGSVRMTFAFGCLLTLMLGIMSFLASKEVHIVLGLLIVGLSVLPALTIFIRLWSISSRALDPIRMRLTEMESEIKSPDAPA